MRRPPSPPPLPTPRVLRDGGGVVASGPVVVTPPPPPVVACGAGKALVPTSPQCSPGKSRQKYLELEADFSARALFWDCRSHAGFIFRNKLFTVAPGRRFPGSLDGFRSVVRCAAFLVFCSSYHLLIQPSFTSANEKDGTHGIDKFWTTGAKKGPRTVRDVPKNKLDELKNWRVTPQQFCIDVLPGHLWKATIWPFHNDTIAFWSLCVTNTYMLTWTAHHVIRTTRFEPWDGIHWRLQRLIRRLVHTPANSLPTGALPHDICHLSAP